MSGLLVRWSWRDLRARWVQVVVIALVVALGTGMYAGLMSNARWAEMSYDASYAEANMYDVRVSLATGSFAPTGALAAAVADATNGEVSAVEERLLIPTQFDASTGGETIIVRGMLVGSSPGATINRIDVQAGESLPGDPADPVVLLERNFALFYDLPASGSIVLAGGTAVPYVGHGVAPEYFVVQPPEGGFFSQAEYGVLFAGLATAQRLSGFDDVVNDVLIDSVPGVDPAELAVDLGAALESSVPELGATVTTGDEDPTLRLLYDDLEGDRQFFQIFAALIFAGAVAAAFNLTSRMVEATRREFGIAMALGVPRRRVAVRPLLVGAQIALLGVLAGVGVGLLINQSMGQVLRDYLPLPVWRTPFLIEQFAGGAAIGFLAPFVAAAVPVWRALRVKPVDAIRTGHLAARGGGWAGALRNLPGDSFAKIPFRNLLRAPRRAILTAVGIAAAVTVLVGMVVMVDSFLATVDAGAAEVTAMAPDRTLVGFDTVRSVGSPEVTGVIEADTVGIAEPGLRLPAEATAGEVDLDLLLDVIDLESELWRPTLSHPVSASTPGIVLAEKAAADLGVTVGDSVTLRHPQRRGLSSFAMVETEMVVSATHPHPFRFVAYLDDAHAPMLGMEGLANTMSLVPEEGSDLAAVQRELFENPAVTSVQGAGAIAEIIREFLSQFLGILQIAEFGAVALMFLIAFNSAAVAFDERRREIATMEAYGVRPRTLLRMAIVENGALGLVATALGALGAAAFVRFAVQTNVEETVPDIGLQYVYTPTLIVIVALVGVVAVALAPILTYRRLHKLDVPSTLRVME